MKSNSPAKEKWPIVIRYVNNRHRAEGGTEPDTDEISLGY